MSFRTGSSDALEDFGESVGPGRAAVVTVGSYMILDFRRCGTPRLESTFGFRRAKPAGTKGRSTRNGVAGFRLVAAL